MGLRESELFFEPPPIELLRSEVMSDITESFLVPRRFNVSGLSIIDGFLVFFLISFFAGIRIWFEVVSLGPSEP